MRGDPSFPEGLCHFLAYDDQQVAGRIHDHASRGEDAGLGAAEIDGGAQDYRAAAQRALDAGLLVVMDRCWLKEHMRAQR